MCIEGKGTPYASKIDIPEDAIIGRTSTILTKCCFLPPVPHRQTIVDGTGGGSGSKTTDTKASDGTYKYVRQNKLTLLAFSTPKRQY